jgi:hypothetical protein
MTSFTNGGVVSVPVGDYRVTDFWIRPGILLVGASKRGCVILPENLTNTYGVGLTQPNSRIENLTIDGTNSTGYGVIINGSKTASMQHVVISGFVNTVATLDGAGLVIQSTWSHSIRDTEITGCRYCAYLYADGGEINQILFDNCTLESSASTGVVIEKGANISFTSCSFGNHGAGSAKAIYVSDTGATISLTSNWFESTTYAIDFTGKTLFATGNHCTGRIAARSGECIVQSNTFFGYGGYIDAPASSTANISISRNIHSDGYPLFVNTSGGVIREAEMKQALVVGTLSPETSGTITPFAVEDSILETTDGFNATIFGRLSVQAVSSPVGTYITLGGLTNTPADLLEKADYAAGTCVFYDVGTATYSVLPAFVVGGSAGIRVYIDASTVVGNDTFTFNVTYPVQL